MKLPSKPNTSSKLSTPTSASQTSAAGAAKPDKTSGSIQALINTWAKVESSQALPPSQNQQVLRQLAQLQGQTLNTPQGNISGGISEKLNLGNIAQNLTSSSPLPETLKLVLIKLLSVKGPINILSERPLTPNTQVLLTQNTQGKLSLQTAQPAILLNQFRSQFMGQNFIPTPIPLIDNHQGSSKPNQLANYLTPLPNSTLKSEQTPNINTLQKALSNSGHNLESKLAQLLNSQPSAKAAQPHQHSTEPSTSQNNNGDMGMSKKMAQVEQNIQKWVALFQQKLDKPKSAHPESIPVTPQSKAAITNNLALGLSVGSLKHNSQPVSNNPSSTPQTSNPQANSLNSDHKTWLIQNQHALMEQLNTRLAHQKDNFIPHWPGLAQGGQDSASGIKTFQDLSQWLTLLMAPKQNPNGQGEPLWPRALSPQPQLQQTLSALLNSLMQSDSESSDINLLRQLININQNLSKLTHDQIQNRLWQGQSDTTQFQLSLPFVQQSHVQWCEFECKQQSTEQIDQDKITGWHLILRFAQNTNNAFAIESHLKQEQLGLTLWANQAEQLKQLNENIPIIKYKLENAGFKVDQINTKHGAPKPLNNPIQQSLIDVHT